MGDGKCFSGFAIKDAHTGWKAIGVIFRQATTPLLCKSPSWQTFRTFLLFLLFRGQGEGRKSLRRKGGGGYFYLEIERGGSEEGRRGGAHRR